MIPFYQNDQVRLYHGDCREVLPELGREHPDDVVGDVLVTDPPYGTKGTFRSKRWTDVAGDDSTDLRDGLLLWWGNAPAVVFGSWKVQRPGGYRAVLCWDKGDGVGAGDLALPWKASSWEEIYIFGDGFSGHRGAGVLRYTAEPNFRQRSHPTPKPLPLMVHLVSKCPPGVVLDPFAGSGTTLLAAQRLGRQAIGIEVEERYCAAAAKRLAAEAAQLRLPLEAVA